MKKTQLYAAFDRLDICEAYSALEMDWNKGGWLQERASNKRRMESCDVQLDRIGFRAGEGFNGFSSLTRNGRAIYLNATRRMGLR